MNILYWNTNKKALHNEILDLTDQHDINLIILLENNGNDTLLVNGLRFFGNFYPASTKLFNKGKIFFDRPILSIDEVHGHTRYGIYLIKLDNNKTLLCGVVHFPSKVNWGNTNDHLGLCVELRLALEEVEKRLDIKHSFIIGDFNMNPFEEGFLNVAALNNVSVKSVAKNIKNNIYGNSYKKFYNPMWNFLGDSSKGSVPGTFFYNTSKYVNHYWNMYDQLLLRPEMIDSFVESKFDILSSIKGNSLLITNRNKVQVINPKISDHLPLLIVFDKYTL